MLTLSGTLHNYNDLNMTEGMRARVHSQFYGRKRSYESSIGKPGVWAKPQNGKTKIY